MVSSFQKDIIRPDHYSLTNSLTYKLSIYLITILHYLLNKFNASGLEPNYTHFYKRSIHHNLPIGNNN